MLEDVQAVPRVFFGGSGRAFLAQDLEIAKCGHAFEAFGPALPRPAQKVADVAVDIIPGQHS